MTRADTSATTRTDERPFSVTAGELGLRDDLRTFDHTCSTCHLHYNGPGDSGFGIKRITMLIPECAMLMVSPYGCGRSGTVVGQKEDFEDRVFYYAMDERDLVTGRYLDRLPEACRLIRAKMDPRAILICMTCVDALMGTDLEGLCRRLTKEAGIPVTGCFMDPTVRETNRAPVVKVQQAIAGLLEKRATDSNCINVLGDFTPLDTDGDLFDVLHETGFSTIRELATCAGYDDFLEMATASLNLVVHFQAQSAATDLQSRLDIPFVELIPTYGPRRTAEQYAKLATYLDKPIDCGKYLEQAEDRLEDFARKHVGMRFGIGDAVFGCPLELAETLLDAGIDVPFVMRSVLFPGDLEVAGRLSVKYPDLMICSSVHPSTRRFPEGLPRVDAIIGLDAGYFEKDAISISWGNEEAHFGFELLTSLLDHVEEGLIAPQTHREQMSGSYLTV